MNITLHPPEESTLAEWCDKCGIEIVVVAKHGGGYTAALSTGTFPIAQGASPERAIRHLVNNLTSQGIGLLREMVTIVPKLTGIRTPGDWESFTVEENK